jgi:1-deoxy-D-xylulose 5-phosphate reductoisomerase
MKEVVKQNDDHFQFAAISLGKITSTMEKIIKELDGKSSVATNEEELRRLFFVDKEIIQ